jgi:hypothetical protein
MSKKAATAALAKLAASKRGGARLADMEVCLASPALSLYKPESCQDLRNLAARPASFFALGLSGLPGCRLACDASNRELVQR